MRRSTQVTAPLLAAAALAMLTGCRKPEMQRCVDENNHVVAESFCQSQPGLQQQQPYSTGPIFYPHYRYYYGGWGGYALGSIVGGGGYTPIAGRSYSTSTTRGGFGSSFHSSESSGHGSAGE